MMDGTNRAARMTCLMSMLREVLVKYFTVLVCCNWEKSAENFSCRYPGHFQRIYRQNLLAPITIERSCCQKWPVFLEAAISKGKPFLMSCRINPFDVKFTRLLRLLDAIELQSRHQIALVVWAFHPLNLATMDQDPAQALPIT